MIMSGVSGRRGRALAILAGVGLVFSLSLQASDAQARPRKHHRAKHARAAAPYVPPFAALVVDANSGKVLYAKSEHELRHPASVTKVMTLYMLFEQLERGKMTLDSPITMTRHAATMKPSKLGMRPGETLTAEEAIKALVTKSANDVAAAIADHIGGTEVHFAEMMTAKARSLGMSRTVYANASGLPNTRQITTAHDLVLLGRAIQERFPKYYGYFSTHVFHYAGMSIRNHNNLLGRLEGIDGIKTGYTAASGFNLLSSVRRDGQHIVAVVLGGHSAASRDKIMADLIEDKIELASRSRTAPSVLAQASSRPEPVAEAKPQPQPKVETAKADLKPEPSTKVEVARAEPARTEPQRPIQLASMGPVDLGKARPAYVSGTASDYRGMSMDGSTRGGLTAAAVVPSMTPANNPAPANGMRWSAGPTAAAAAPSKTNLRVETKVARVEPAAEAPRARHAEPKVVEKPRPVAARKGVMIQIGATDADGKAKELLSRAKVSSRGTLAAAVPFTEAVKKGRDTIYRARFAGLSETQAEAACKSLKRSGMGCFTTKN